MNKTGAVLGPGYGPPPDLLQPPVFLATNYDALSAFLCSTNEDDVLHRSSLVACGH